MKSTLQYVFTVCAIMMVVFVQGHARTTVRSNEVIASMQAESSDVSLSADHATTAMGLQHTLITSHVESRDFEPVMIEEEEEEDDKWSTFLAELSHHQTVQIALFINLLSLNLDAVHERMPADSDTSGLVSSKARCLTFCLLRI